MKKTFKCLFVFLSAFICMCGCWNESVEDVSGSKLIGYSGDSLVVYIEEKTEETCLAKPLGDDCFTRELGTRFVVDNFYTKENIWKSDKIKDKYITNVYDLIDDTTIIEYDRRNAFFYRRHLGGGYEKLGSFSWFGCDMSRNVGTIRPWGDGHWRLSRTYGYGDSCAYAVVNVENREITGYAELDEFAKGCLDVWKHEGKKYCVGLISKDTVLSYYDRTVEGIFFKEGENIKDSLWGNQIIDGMIYSPQNVRYMNSFLWLETGGFDRHLIYIDYKNAKLTYVRKYL